MLQVHLSGGEPGARRDLVEITAAARDAGLYTNLITSGGRHHRARRCAGSPMPGSTMCRSRSRTASAASADHIAGYEGAFARKQRARRRGGAARPAADRQRGDAPRQHRSHRRHDRRSRWRSAPSRVEIAHVQYYGWALKNRAALMPTARAGRARGRRRSRSCAQRHHGQIVIDSVVPDYYARFPKPCMGGWGRRSLNVTPSGKVLPCHAAETIPGLDFWNVREHSLADIWAQLAGLQRLSRHRLDAGAVPELRAARDRFRRLPLPGLRADRRRARDRSGLPSLAASRDGRRTRRGAAGLWLTNTGGDEGANGEWRIENGEWRMANGGIAKQRSTVAVAIRCSLFATYRTSAASLLATLTVVVALTTGPWVRAPSERVTPEAETTARNTNDTATAIAAIFAWVLRLALIREWLFMARPLRRHEQ